MKLYFAGSENDAPELRSYGVDRALVAFSTNRLGVLRVVRAFPDVLLDSGAFSAQASGNPINLNGYMSFIKNNDIANYIQLDVIGDDDATDRNLDIMLSNGLTPIPVWHASSTIKRLTRLLSEHDYVCVGGVAAQGVKSSKKGITKRLDTVFAVARDFWPKRIHGLGVQQRWALERYPFYSVDATTWQNGSRYGTVIDKHTMQQTSGMRTMAPDVLERRTRNSHDFAVWGVGHHQDVNKRTEANVRAVLNVEQYITNLWRGRGITFD